VLGSGKLGAPEWSQSRNTVDISQAAEVQSGVELPRIARRGSHVPLCVLAKGLGTARDGSSHFFVVTSTMDSLQPASGPRSLGREQLA